MGTNKSERADSAIYVLSIKKTLSKSDQFSSDSVQ